MAQRDQDNPGEWQQRFPVRARRMDSEGPKGRPGYRSFGAERGYNQGGLGGLGAYQRGERPRGYDEKLDMIEARRAQGPGRPPRGYQRSDDRIREEVCELLMDGPVDVGDVEVTVNNGEVTLNGRVEERWEKRAIEDIAANVRGVHDVHNRVRVRPPEDRPVAQEAARLRDDDRPKEKSGDQPLMGV
ncbi:MAG TPA: BON domain-containing protein [Archangium sp.]|jgi:hypothetical protein|uniref:BON domain-containing protein n=1 Tax=Archangium sp. TaxID=1872627 RepID=UPI002ED918F4